MPNLIISREASGALQAYIAKKDVELPISSLQFDEAEQWGGDIELSDGTKYYIDPISPAPSLPKTVRARRA
ncbi:putative nitrogen fixation protein NifT [Agarivorans sp. MS3-6]|uniref:putative nitrogen fixation protein NifT n=1 Tax=Agarivorans sp. TSD2052 TaxID=2937286 RepID=UPI00200BE3D6|nr:putative nitrogen fixation protein NifT [Agarivorans sp. TSD2052]UPW20324.1 putative nitrogen fixation protein NifT [Agarivorans sp. TSD2052]